MIFQQMSLSTALIFPLRNLVVIPLPDSFECLFDPQRGFGSPLRNFLQSFASPLLEKSRFFLLWRNFLPSYAGTSRMRPRVLAVKTLWEQERAVKTVLCFKQHRWKIGFRLTHCLGGSQLRETWLLAKVNLIYTFQPPSKFSSIVRLKNFTCNKAIMKM